jgi:uncharacterized protein
MRTEGEMNKPKTGAILLSVVLFCISAAFAQSPTSAAFVEAERAYAAGQDARALELFRPLAQSGDVVAQTRIARIYTRNRGVAVNDAESCNWWEAAANRGDSVAMTNIGLCLETGKGRAQDLAKAVGWYREAADRDSVVAMYNLGLAYEYGRGVEQSFEQALQWFQRSLDSNRLSTSSQLDAKRHLERARRNVDAARGEPLAMYEMAALVRTGGGGERRDEKRGLELLRRAAESSGAAVGAIRDFGTATFFGQYSDLSDVRAGQPMTPQQVRRMELYQQEGARWVKRAADAGDQESLVFYATWSACGTGAKKDIVAAEKMLMDAAERGSVRAMQDLADFFESGRCGMRRDPTTAERWRQSAEAAQRSPKKQ